MGGGWVVEGGVLGVGGRVLLEGEGGRRLMLQWDGGGIQCGVVMRG